MSLLVNPEEILTKRIVDPDDLALEVTELRGAEPGTIKPLNKLWIDDYYTWPLQDTYGWQAAYFRRTDYRQIGESTINLTLGKPIYHLVPNGNIDAQMLAAQMPLAYHQKVEQAITDIRGDSNYIRTVLPTILARVTGKDEDIELILYPSGTTETDYRAEDTAHARGHMRVEEMVDEFPAEEEALIRTFYAKLVEYSDALPPVSA